MHGPYQIALGFPEQCRQKSAVTLTLPKLRPVHLLVMFALAALAAVLVAQIEGERGVPPIASGTDFEVDDIHVDIFGPDADTARQSGWKLAQRKAWKELWKRTNGGEGPSLGDSVLDGLVSGIEVRQEQIGPTRYIATVAVLFDRARAGQALGVSSFVRRSPPLLVIPVITDGGVSTTFETVTEWQKAWASFRTGDSAIDYVRPAGDGPDAILLNAAQISRRGRGWWRTLLEQYGAADVIMPLVRLERSWPGGPIIGHFSARFGPDNAFIDSFDLRARSADQLPQMMAQGVRQMDQLYTQAFNTGVLRLDPSLVVEEPLNAVELGNISELGSILSALPSESASAPVAGSITVQFDTPSVESVRATETAIRAIPGVRSAATTSLALGGTSVMQVAFDGPPDQLRAALEARGMAVSGSGAALRVSRRPSGGAGGPQ
ncbi:MAG: heavy-metal-associated domain-containing protein [Sphingobium sp.]|nr:heavy-metal-associated domain-containing protein [Sphingobium sp.]